MSEDKRQDDSHEMVVHLSSIQKHVDSSLQDLGNRKELVRASSNKSIEVAKDLNGRLGTLQKYSSALSLKRKDIQDSINLFNQKNTEQINDLNQKENDINKELESLNDKLTNISNQIDHNKKQKDTIAYQMDLYEKEIENLDIQYSKYQEILNRPVPLDRNDEIEDSILEVQRSLELIDEKIRFKLNQLQKYKADIQILHPIIQISKSLKRVNDRYAQVQEDEYLVNKRIEIEKSISQEKEEKLRLLFSQIKENNTGIDTFRNNLMQIKATDIQIDREKEKKSQAISSCAIIESELRRIGQEYDIEINKEIKIAHELNELEEKERNRDPKLVLIEKKMEELSVELDLLLQKKDDLTIVENSLQNEIYKFDQKTLLIKEKMSKEILEGAIFYEQKLYKEIRSQSNAIDNMNKEIEDLIMRINVFEAERKRLYKKIAMTANKIEKYKEKEIKLKKLKKMKKKNVKKLNDLQFLIETLQFQINQLICVNDHKKEDIQTKKLRIEQTILKFYLPNTHQSYSKSNVLNPIVPILSKREETAKIISKTASYITKVFLLQKNTWKDINPSEIKDAFERWEDTLYKIQPSIEKDILQALVELVC